MSESTKTSTSQQAVEVAKARWYVTGNYEIRFWSGALIAVCLCFDFALAATCFVFDDYQHVMALVRSLAVIAFMAAVWCATFVRRGAPNAKYAAEIAAVVSELLVPESEPHTLHERLLDQNVRLRRENSQIEELARRVRTERAERAAWLTSLPAGSCGNPPPASLLEAEAATGATLASIERGGT